MPHKPTTISKYNYYMCINKKVEIEQDNANILSLSKDNPIKIEYERLVNLIDIHEKERFGYALSKELSELDMQGVFNIYLENTEAKIVEGCDETYMVTFNKDELAKLGRAILLIADQMPE